MKGERETKRQLIDALVKLRQRVAELGAEDTKRLSAEQTGGQA